MKRIVVLAFDGAQVLDITGPTEVFSSANHFALQQEYEITCLGTSAAPALMSSGLSLNATHFSAFEGVIDTIIVPGGSENALIELQHTPPFLAWLKAQCSDARRVVSVCTGAFVLAELGLLDGRRASTHWSACDRLQRFAPRAVVDPDAIYSQDGSIYTSAGVTTGIDLALRLVEDDLGKAVATKVARNLVLYLRRSGGQSQFSLPLSLQTASNSRVEKMCDYIRDNIHLELGVNALADQFSVSPRQCSRLFVAETGLPPAKYVALVRLDVARLYLEQTRLSLQQIAKKCGYGSTDTLGRVFRSEFGVTPSQYRMSFA